MEPILKIWYEGLKKGKIEGLKCKECGQVMFPPVPVCSACGCMETEWTPMSRKGELFQAGYSPSGIPGYFDDPAVIGYIKLEEGMIMSALVEGVDTKKGLAKLEKKMPMQVTLGIHEYNDLVSFPSIIVEDSEE